MNNDLSLTPAQADFVCCHVPEYSGKEWKISYAGQAGSQRVFLRLAPKNRRGNSYILVIWDGKDEDWGRFHAIPLEVAPHLPFFPAIYASDRARGLILEEDLGDMTLHGAVAGGGAMDSYHRALDALCRWQSLDERVSPAVASRVMDAATFLWETDYFARRCVADFFGCEGALGSGWESERRELASEAAALPRTFLHRDFQSENILFTDNGVKFVDFQGARLGPPAYDLASLLCDPYVSSLDADRRASLFEYFCSLGPPVPVGPRDFDLCAVQRLTQACGAYGNLSVHKGKTRYREYIPVALERLAGVMERLPEYPAMRKVVDRCFRKCR